MKVSKFQKCESIIAGIFTFALCVMFFITLISSIIVLSEPLAALTFKEEILVLGSILYELALLVSVMLYYFNIHERSQIGVLRAFDNTDAIGYSALRRSRAITVFSILLIIAGSFMVLGFTSVKSLLVIYTGKVVVRNVMFISFAINVVLLFAAAIAGAKATDKYNETIDMVHNWILLLTSIDVIAKKSATEAKKDIYFSDDCREKMHDKIEALPLFKEFPSDEGILTVYANSVFDDILFDRK